MRLFCIIFLVLFSSVGCASSEEIQQRIKPLGKVHIETVDSEITTLKIAIKKKSGKKIYTKHCIICHRDGLAGAPRFRNAEDWKPRLTGKKLSDLVTSAIKGLNAMPAKGTCLDCSKEDLQAAITYMMPKHD
ncbi:MAG: c-type cytochrome [bacterium]|nr:c-type cytochrome [bacterium]